MNRGSGAARSKQDAQEASASASGGSGLGLAVVGTLAYEFTVSLPLYFDATQSFVTVVRTAAETSTLTAVKFSYPKIGRAHV